MRRVLGAVVILGGCLILIVQIPTLDEKVVVSLGAGHGIHVSDALGLLVAAVGVALMWGGGT
jgi:hypothetical protein